MRTIGAISAVSWPDGKAGRSPGDRQASPNVAFEATLEDGELSITQIPEDGRRPRRLGARVANQRERSLQGQAVHGRH